jgi:hypothetical protein
MFFCVMSNLIQANARERSASIAAALNRGSSPGAIQIGVAQLRDHETASGLIERAASELNRTPR